MYITRTISAYYCYTIERLYYYHYHILVAQIIYTMHECQGFIVDGGVVKRSPLLVSTLVKALFYLLEQDCTESEHIYHRGKDRILMKP